MFIFPIILLLCIFFVAPIVWLIWEAIHAPYYDAATGEFIGRDPGDFVPSDWTD